MKRRWIKTARDRLAPYVTKDGSTVRELMHPERHGVRNLSLAEAVVEPGSVTTRHLHRLSEEVYHIIEGQGVMVLGTESFSVTVGDTVVIPPGTAHQISARGPAPLRILCCCSPPYSHQDTELLE